MESKVVLFRGTDQIRQGILGKMSKFCPPDDIKQKSEFFMIISLQILFKPIRCSAYCLILRAPAGIFRRAETVNRQPSTVNHKHDF